MTVWRTAVTPRWAGLLVVALALAAVMTVLGFWQLDVYRSKTAEATAARAAQPPVPLDLLLPLDEGLSGKVVGRQVTVSGRWAPASDQIFVSDRLQGSRTGYWVVTPLLVGDGSAAVLVVRGWVPDVSAADAASGEVSVTGTLVASEAEDASDAAARGRVLPSLRLPTMVGMVDYRLYDAFVMLSSSTPPTTAEVVPPPPPPTDHAGLRNIAYAVQWWIFALFALFMWWRMVRDAHHDRSERPESTVSA